MSVLDPGQIAMLESLGSDVFAEIAGVYVQTTPADLTALNEALAAGDLVRLRKRAHALKGASANIGARGLWALCQELETSADPADLVSRVNAEHAAVVVALRARTG